MPVFYDKDFYLANSAGTPGIIGQIHFGLQNIPDGASFEITIPTMGGDDTMVLAGVSNEFMVAQLFRDAIDIVDITGAAAGVAIIAGTGGAGLISLFNGGKLQLYNAANTQFGELAVGALTANRFYALPDGDCNLLGDSVAAGIAAEFIFSVAPSITQDASASSPWLYLFDSSNGNRLALVCSGAIGVDADLIVPSAGGRVVVSGTAISTGRIPFAASSGVLSHDADLTFATDTLTATKISGRMIPRVVVMTDATSFTPTGDTADINTQANTQALGTLTANAPSGTPTNGQQLIVRIKSTNVQTFAWNAIYRGGTTVALPATSSGASKTDYLEFRYNSADSKWDIQRSNLGY